MSLLLSPALRLQVNEPSCSWIGAEAFSTETDSIDLRCVSYCAQRDSLELAEA